MKYLFWIILVLVAIVRIASSGSSYIDGDEIQISSRISSEPIRYEYSQGVKLSGVFVYLPLVPEVYYGDFVVVKGIVDDGKLSDAKLINYRQNDGPLFALRRKIIGVYKRSLPVPHDSLVAGMVLGSKALTSSEFWDQLKITGTAHVVVASGMNVTLLAGFLISTLVIFMKRKKAIVIALVGVWIYALLAGFDAPIVRAAIMGSIAFSAVAVGRVKVAWRMLFLSALIMLIVWPEWVGDVGFALSFVATASLMAFESPIRRRLTRFPRVIREDLSTSLAAQIGVTPILFVVFGYFNILSPVINVLILWTVVPITIIGAIGGMVGIICEPLGKMILLLIYPITSWFVWIVGFFG